MADECNAREEEEEQEEGGGDLRNQVTGGVGDKECSLRARAAPKCNSQVLQRVFWNAPLSVFFSSFQ